MYQQLQNRVSSDLSSVVALTGAGSEMSSEEDLCRPLSKTAPCSRSLWLVRVPDSFLDLANGQRLGCASLPLPPRCFSRPLCSRLRSLATDASSDEDTKKPLPPPVPAVKKGRFADEDADDDVKDDWDVSDDEDKPKPQVVVGSLRNKGATKQKIAQKEAEERKKAEEAERLVSRASLESRIRGPSALAHPCGVLRLLDRD